MSTYKVTCPASAAPVLVRKGPTCVDDIFLTNLCGTLRHLKLFDAASADDVTVGTTKPDVVIPVPPANATPFFTQVDLDAQFGKGLVVAIVQELADDGTTAPAARDIVGTIGYGLPGCD